MFQIETALLKFDEISGSQSGKTSVVKRYALDLRITSGPCYEKNA
jgi:hypothetical protein